MPSRPPTLITAARDDVPSYVRKVIDGRTVELDGGRRVQISLLAQPAECWAAAASEFARKTLLERPVYVTSLVPDEVNLELADGTDYALLAVSEGVLRAQGAAGAIAEAEALAAREDRGLWGLPCNGLDSTTTTTTPPTPVQPPVTTTTTTPPPPPPPPCTVTYRIGGQWPGGFQADVVIRNTGDDAIDGWTLEWSFSDGQRVEHMWNASSSQRGAAVRATNVDYTTTIEPGDEVTVGFLGSMRGRNTAPSSFTLNGTACATQ
ncbi:cellulose binding domain-containing protein [Lentzea sp. NPDC004789]